MPRKAGDTVRIYEDPLTETKFEGEAKLIEQVSEDDEREFWLVEFTRGHERHPRWIKKANPNLFLIPINVLVEFAKVPSHQRREHIRKWLEANHQVVGKDAEQIVDDTMQDIRKYELHHEYGHEGHHSDGSKPQTISGYVQYFVAEEEKGIGEYNEFLERYGFHLAPDERAVFNRIIEEQRNHVQMLKRLWGVPVS